jgi:hypothetical protein
MSQGLQCVELKYSTNDTQVFAVFKVVNHFRPYLLISHTKIIVPHSMVRVLLIKKEPVDRRGNWITTLQEYELEINPTKLVKGQGLGKLVAKELDPQKKEEEGWDNEVDLLQSEVLYIPASTNSWYNDIKHYLTHGRSPNHLDSRKKRALRLKYA